MRRDDVQLLRDGPWVATAMELWGRSRRLAPRGRTPSPKLVRGLFQESVALQQTVWTDDGYPVGLFQVSEVSEKDGSGQLDVLVAPDPDHAEALSQALTSFTSEVFAASPLRKLCLWACADELTVPTYLGTTARQVGRLVGHDRRGPMDHADMLVYELWKEDVA